MATFEDIQKANNTIQTTDIRGKSYADVAQRVKAFRQVYPTGYIRTEMISNEGGVCVFRAECGVGTQPLGTGTAYEKEGSSNINRTSYIENCETSAVGRALGFAGFGIDTAIASAEEVRGAISAQQAQEHAPRAQKPSARLTEASAAKLREAAAQININLPELLRRYHVNEVEELSTAQYTAIMKQIQAHMDKQEGKE